MFGIQVYILLPTYAFVKLSRVLFYGVCAFNDLDNFIEHYGFNGFATSLICIILHSKISSLLLNFLTLFALKKLFLLITFQKLVHLSLEMMGNRTQELLIHRPRVLPI